MHTGRPLLYFLLKIANDLMIMFQALPNVWVLRPRHAHCIDKNAKYSGRSSRLFSNYWHRNLQIGLLDDMIPLLLANVGDVMVVMVTCLLEKNDGGLQNFCKVFFFLVFILLLLKAYTKVSRKQ